MEQSISPDTFDLLMLKVANEGKATFEFNSVIITIELNYVKRVRAIGR